MLTTVVSALVLGVFISLIQLSVDFGQEKKAVAEEASRLVESALPTAEEAVWTYDDKLAHRVADGLFTRRAISRVRILNEARPVLDLHRDVERTLPHIQGLTGPDEVLIRYDLLMPQAEASAKPIGRIEVTVDRSIVPPSIVDRMSYYFLFGCLKTILLGFVLFIVVYAAMGRHLTEIANIVRDWRPGSGSLTLPPTPSLLRNTEIEMLAGRVHFLAAMAEREVSNLEQTVREQNSMLERERELNGLQRQFVSMVSHEFRTPLAIIDGTAQQLLRRPERASRDRLANALGKVRKSVSRLTGLIEAVLDAAQLEEGRIRLQPGDCKIRGVLEDLVEAYLETYAAHRIELAVEDLPDLITADERLVRQIFSNLLSNAVKYSPEGTIVYVKGWQDGDDVMISIQDNGVGIPNDELAKLFKRFFRASTSTGIAGTGIGLHLIQHFVQLHRGSIEVKSQEGIGSTFTVRLPTQQERARNKGREIGGSKGFGSIVGLAGDPSR